MCAIPVSQTDFPAAHNALIAAGEPLYQALITLTLGRIPPDIPVFRRQMLQALSHFYRQCGTRQIHPSVTEKGAFVYCAALDEAVLSTPWGAQSVWHEHTLTSTVFQNRQGGEDFFRWLRLAGHNPVVLRDFLELQFHLLSLGFKGKYRTQPEALTACYTGLRHLLSDNRTPPVVSPYAPQLPVRPVRLIPLCKVTLAVVLTGIALRMAADVAWQNMLHEISTALTALF